MKAQEVHLETDNQPDSFAKPTSKGQEENKRSMFAENSIKEGLSQGASRTELQCRSEIFLNVSYW